VDARTLFVAAIAAVAALLFSLGQMKVGGASPDPGGR
jgi:hypothetical protein